MKKHIPSVFYMVLFAGLMVMIGIELPNVYFRYFDSREYYQVKNVSLLNSVPVCPDGEVHPVWMVIDRSADFPVNAVVYRELRNVKTKVVVWRDSGREVILEKGDQRIMVQVELGCVPVGEYELITSIEYKIRGVNKTYIYTVPVRVER